MRSYRYFRLNNAQTEKKTFEAELKGISWTSSLSWQRISLSSSSTNLWPKPRRATLLFSWKFILFSCWFVDPSYTAHPESLFLCLCLLLPALPFLYLYLYFLRLRGFSFTFRVFLTSTRRISLSLSLGIITSKARPQRSCNSEFPPFFFHFLPKAGLPTWSFGFFVSLRQPPPS